MIVVDTSAVLVAADRRDPLASRVQAVMAAEPEAPVLPAPLAGEIDYMLTRDFGTRSARSFLADIAAGSLRVECLEPAEYSTLLALTDRYADLAPGLADLSIVVLAHRFGTNRILTFDQRHFRAMSPIAGGAFELLPADATGSPA